MENKTSTKKIFVNSIIYSASGILLKCFNFFLLPLYTTYLTTEDYGITSIAVSFINTAAFIVAFSLFSTVMRFYVDLKSDQVRLKRFYGTVSTFIFISSLCFFALLTAFRGIVSEKVFSGVDYYPVILICLISLVFHCQQVIYDNILRSQQRALKSSILSIAYFFSTFAFNIIFVVILKKGAVGSLLATMISYVIYTIYFHVSMNIKHEITYCFDWKLLKDALKYSIPILPHNLSTNIAQLISKVLISGSSSLASVGIYTVASQFGSIADTIQVYVDQAYGPWLYEKLHDRDEGYKEAIRRISRVLCVVIGFFFIAIGLFAQDYIVLLINKSYADAWKYVPLIVLVFAIKTVYYFYVEVLFYYKKASKYLFTATLSSSLLNILLSYWLIPLLDVYGSILADAISMIIRVVIIGFISNKYEKIGLQMRDFITNFFVIAIFLGMGLAPSYLLWGGQFSIKNLAYKIVVLGVYMGIFYFIYRDDIRHLVAMAKSKLLRKKSD